MNPESIHQGYYFQYPAKILHVEKLPVNPDSRFTFEGYNFLEFVGKSLYMDSKTGKPKFQTVNNHASYWIEAAPGVFVSLGGFYDRERFNVAMALHIQAGRIESLIKEFLANAADIPAYEARQAAAIAEEKAAQAAEDARREAEAARREEARRQAREDQLTKAQELFKAGDRIQWEEFEALCERHGIKINMRTKGSGRASVKLIGHESMNVLTGRRPDMALRYAKELFQKLNPTT